MKDMIFTVMNFYPDEEERDSTLCGHVLEQMTWTIATDEDDTLCGLIEGLPDFFELSHEDFVALLRTAPLSSLEILRIKLDHCRIDLFVKTREIVLKYDNGNTARMTANIDPIGKGNDASQMANIALYLINTIYRDDIDHKLAKMRALGMIL